jgi:hypothetical protein
MESLLVCNWPHYVGQNHLCVMMLFNKDSTIQSASENFAQDFESEKFGSLSTVQTMCLTVQTPNCPQHHSSRRRDIPSGRPTVLSIIRSDGEIFSSRHSSVSRSFKLLQLASVWTFQQPVRTTLSVRSSFRISFQT